MAAVINGNKVPLYSQIALAIRQRIRTGVYLPGQALPSLRDLSAEFKVSLRVVQLAVHDLEKTGILATHHGKSVTVMETERCERAAILFGFIQPYTSNLAFDSQVFHYAGQVFNHLDNFLVTRSSEGSAEQEREVARHLLKNGVQGLLLWPIENDPNAKFFADLARQIPVVVVDRLLEKSGLPAVIFDSYENGRAICRHMLKKLRRQRLLAVIDNLKISPYQALMQGLRDEADALGRTADLTVIQLPISETLTKMATGFAAQVEIYAPYIERLLREGGYDALFCPQGEFVDYFIVEPGVLSKFADLRLGILCGTEADPNLAKLQELGVLQWVVDHPQMISQGADLLQQWVLSRQPPKDVAPITVTLKNGRTP